MQTYILYSHVFFEPVHELFKTDHWSNVRVNFLNIMQRLFHDGGRTNWLIFHCWNITDKHLYYDYEDTKNIMAVNHACSHAAWRISISNLWQSFEYIDPICKRKSKASIESLIKHASRDSTRSHTYILSVWSSIHPYYNAYLVTV